MKIDDIECTPVEVAIYAATFAAQAVYAGPVSNAPQGAKRAGFYNNTPGTTGAITKAQWAKNYAENAVRWHRELEK